MDSEGEDFLAELKEWSRKEKEGRPPNEEELADCKQIQEYESKIILTRQMLRRARKRLKRATPNSEASMRAAKDVERFNEAMKIANEVTEMTGECPVLNCTKHPVFRKEDTLTEGEATSCTDMDTDSEIDDHELAATTSEGKTDEEEFQMVYPRKAARETQQPEPIPVKTANTYNQLAEENIQKETPKSIPEINLKIIPNYNLILKEINQQFPNTENRFRREFIGIKADTKENREKIINLLKQKKLEFVLSEAYEDRPGKVVIRDLPIDMEISEIIQSLEEKRYRFGRASQMKNYEEKRPLPLYLIDVQKYGNYANFYNENQLCYLKVKIVPYRQRKKATICFDFSGYFHSARNCQMRPRCIKCNDQHATRECSIKEKITDPTCINCGEQGHLAAWNGCKALPTIKKPSARQSGRTYVQAAADNNKKDEKAEEKSTEQNTDVADDLNESKESIQALIEMKTLLQEFPTLLEVARPCRKATTKKEKVLIVLNALLSD